MLRFLLIPLVFFFVSCSTSSSDQSEGRLIGEQAPDFTYNSLQGESVTLSSFQGKVVYIFFFGANCPHCRSNGPVTETTIYQSFNENENFVALGLDTWNTSAGAVENFRTVTGISYTLLLQARQSLVDYYGNSSDYDRSVVIAADGTVAYQGTQFVNRDANEVVSVIESELAKIQ